METLLTALSLAATAALKDTASQAIKDAYTGLKGKIAQRFAANSKHTLILAEHSEDPDTYAKPMEKALVESGASHDPELLDLARKLLNLLQSSASGRTNVQFNGPVKGAVIGDNTQVTMHFNGKGAK